jgi:hypothetical protein
MHISRRHRSDSGCGAIPHVQTELAQVAEAGVEVLFSPRGNKIDIAVRTERARRRKAPSIELEEVVDRVLIEVLVRAKVSIDQVQCAEGE